MPANFIKAIALILCLFVLTCRTSGAAETTLADRNADWEQTASRVELLLQDTEAGTAALEYLRTKLVTQRADAFKMITDGNIRTQTLQAELDALGPAPKDGEKQEATAIAQRRSDLINALAEANAPVIAAKQAFSRADVLIKAIDNVIRAAGQKKLFERQQSGLSPSLWLPAVSELIVVGKTFWLEAASQIGAPDSDAHKNWVASAVFALAGLAVVFLVNPILVHRFEERAVKQIDTKRKNLFVAIGIVSRLFLPLFGVAFLIASVEILNLLPISGVYFKQVATSLAYLLVLPVWINDLIFAPNLADRRILPVKTETAHQTFYLALGLSFILIVELVLQSFDSSGKLNEPAISVAGTIIVAVAAALLWKFSLVLRTAFAHDPHHKHDMFTAEQAVRVVSILVQIIAFAAVAFAVAGYIRLSRNAIDPLILSLVFGGLLIATYNLVIWLLTTFVFKTSHQAKPDLALYPVAVAVALAILSMPMFAIIWGARTSDVSEIMLAVSQGFELGGTRISLNHGILLIVIFAIGLFFTKWLQSFLSKVVMPRTRFDSGVRNAVVTGTGYLGVIASVLFAVSWTGLDLSNLALVAGALSVGVGLGLQAVVSNFVSGIILLIEQPIKEGDWIEVSGYSGIVQKISVRSTRITTFDRHDVIIPNGDLITGVVMNMTLTSKSGRLIVPISVAYETDMELARSLLMDVVRNNTRIEKWPEPIVLFSGMGDSALEFEIRCFVNDNLEALSAKSEILFEIYKQFKLNGIEIPYQKHDVYVKNLAELTALRTVAPAANGADAPT